MSKGSYDSTIARAKSMARVTGKRKYGAHKHMARMSSSSRLKRR